jgi:hypothetical protein
MKLSRRDTQTVLSALYYAAQHEVGMLDVINNGKIKDATPEFIQSVKMNIQSFRELRARLKAKHT